MPNVISLPREITRGILGRYWIHMGVRALETFRPVLRTKALEHILRENTTGCNRELTDTSHFHLKFDLCTEIRFFLVQEGKK